ncbi:CapA family protein [Brevibacillus sp. MER 51]|uniref:CapA family protein n=1 Tax=Brevibacillus sp. MER 51 TaxID=2939560 RepID=UPI00203C71B4|nr:CapA family protein [Brevibacillus sp. MER 51]MCM3143236.1 CapA family protein [Brevibacillus sp. MER 51]
MNENRSSRIHARRKRSRRKWVRMGKNTLLFSLLAIFVVGTYYLFQIAMDGEHANPNTQPTPDNTANQKTSVQLTFVGDIMMSGNVEKTLLANSYDYPYKHVSSLFLQDDITIANLETPITATGVAAQNKEYVYKSSPLAVPAMKNAGIDVVNLANNHSMDQGVPGLLDTFDALDENRIEYVGAGKDASRAYSPVFIEKNGIKIAILGFSRVIPETSWFAGDSQPGMAASYDPTLAVKAIQDANSQADLVVVIAHWGKERSDYPVDHQKELSRAYIDAGADLIVGGHPHVLQGFERYNDKWIAYSLGNFIFTRSNEPKTWETMVLQASCTKSGDCELTMLPFHAELGQAVPMNESNGAALLKRIESISESVDIQSDGRVQPHANAVETAP